MKLPLFPSCRETVRRVSAQLDTSLSKSARIGLWLHLAACRHCRRYASQIRLVHSLLGDYPDRLTRLHLSARRQQTIVAELRRLP